MMPTRRKLRWRRGGILDGKNRPPKPRVKDGIKASASATKESATLTIPAAREPMALAGGGKAARPIPTRALVLQQDLVDHSNSESNFVAGLWDARGPCVAAELPRSLRFGLFYNPWSGGSQYEEPDPLPSIPNHTD